MGVVHLREPAPPPTGEESELHVYVIYTSADATRRAIEFASRYAHDLGARLELVVPEVVPFPRELDDPTIAASFTEQHLRNLIGRCDTPASVTVLLCRDGEETVSRRLPKDAVAVVGRRRRWGPGAFRRLLRTLARDGHQVLVVDSGQSGIAAPAVRRGARL